MGIRFNAQKSKEAGSPHGMLFTWPLILNETGACYLWDMEIIQLILVVMFITVLVDRVLLFQTMVLRLQHPKLKLWRSYLEGMFSLKDLSGKNGIKMTEDEKKVGFLSL